MKNKLAITTALLTLPLFVSSVQASETPESVTNSLVNPMVAYQDSGSYGTRAFVMPEDMVPATYNFGETTFSNYVWVKGGATFTDFQTMSLELETRSLVSFYFYNSAGQFQYEQRFDETAGWISSAEMFRWGDWKIKLVNRGSSTVKVKWGSVDYYQSIYA